MKKLFMTILILTLAGPVLRSAPATVSGRLINGKGYIIRLMTYSDQLSYLRQTMQSDTVHEDELFSFSIEINAVKYCWLDVEFQQVELFLQPGQSYELDIDLKDQSLSSSYYNRGNLPFKIIKDDDDHLNSSIQDFNQLYNDFLLNYSQKIREGNSRSAFDNFIKAIDLRFQNARNPFFLDYVKYKTASMQLFMRTKSRENIGLDYITNQPVLYDNLEYMDFFHLYFEKYFLSVGKYVDYNKSYDMINGNASAADILDSLKADPVLKDTPVRELLLLDGLKELYHVSGFKRSRIIALINEIAKSGRTYDSRMLAENLITRLKRLQPGTPAPEFDLRDVNTMQDYKLSDFAGKYVYLAFFDSQNMASQSELSMVTDVYEEFRNKVAFVAISVDKDMAVLHEYLKKADLPWQVLSYGGNLDLLEQYDASTYPHFILIDDKGQIARCPAPSPSENIRKLFSSF